MPGWCSRARIWASWAKRLSRAGEARPGRIDLEGDGAARAVLLRLVDGAHAPFAEQADHAVAGDGREPGCGRRERLRARSGQGAAQEGLGRVGAAVELHELLHGRTQVRVAGALLVQERRQPRRIQVDRLVEQLFDAPRGGFGHRDVSLGCARLKRAA